MAISEVVLTPSISSEAIMTKSSNAALAIDPMNSTSMASTFALTRTRSSTFTRPLAINRPTTKTTIANAILMDQGTT